MNKRSAMLVAAGLVLTLIVGGVAVAVGMTGPSSSAAAPRLARHQKAPKPIVRTIKKTVKVHRKSPQIAVAVPATTTYSSSGYSGPSGSDTGSGPGPTNHSGSSGTSYGGGGGDDTSSPAPVDNGGDPTNNGGSGGGDD